MYLEKNLHEKLWHTYIFVCFFPIAISDAYKIYGDVWHACKWLMEVEH